MTIFGRGGERGWGHFVDHEGRNLRPNRWQHLVVHDNSMSLGNAWIEWSVSDWIVIVCFVQLVDLADPNIPLVWPNLISARELHPRGPWDIGRERFRPESIGLWSLVVVRLRALCWLVVVSRSCWPVTRRHARRGRGHRSDRGERRHRHRG